MVNENAGKKYEPTPVYCRRAMRDVIRAQAKQKVGFHSVSEMVRLAFHEIRDKKENENV